MVDQDGMTARASGHCDISVIIPALHEQDSINSQIEHLRRQDFQGCVEVIVVDGEPDGGTLKVIEDADVVRMVSERGRARQMNAGAAAADGEILLFLHADTKLPPGALAKISEMLEKDEYVGGAFDLGIDSDRLFLRFIAARARFRSRLTRVPYGDQAIFVRRDYFERIGRFKEIPLMEDIDLMKRIRRDGRRIFILRDRVSTSARRWEKEGAFYATARNQVLATLYHLGVSPERLSRYYRNHRRDNELPR